MAPAGGVIALITAVTALPHSGAFNLHPAPHWTWTHSGRSFGHRVLQLHGGRVLVGAPTEEGEGRLLQCRVRSSGCRGVPGTGNSTQVHLGMALARDGNGSIACGPGLSRECDRNVHTSGLCVLLDPQLNPRRVLAPGYQACVPALVDLVFLFDGSSSINPGQFLAVKDFMVDVMEKLENTSIRFGAVQFSAGVRPQFSLADFAARPRPRELLEGLEQLGHLTDTFGALRYVTRTTFSPALGARPGARRVLILITDGDATDDDPDAVLEAEANGIVRYVIGVGHNFNSPDTRLYLSQFASSPSDAFVKVLENFEKLRGLFQDIQAKIYDIEGPAPSNRKELWGLPPHPYLALTPPPRWPRPFSGTNDLNRFHLELCSSGMSLEVAHGHRVTGAVGADNWAGGLVEMEEGNEIFVASPTLEENVTDAYLGYAVAGLRVPGRALVAAGAPRHRHVGAVVLFEVLKATGQWRALQTLPGEQVGSYFGATLCALDQAGDTVALLVGAPNHFDGRRGGRVHVYGWKEGSLEVTGELLGAPGHPLGRFGASLVALGDLDGDTLAEVAVGAPMEDEDHGVVYIFSSRPGGVENIYSQRLEGQKVAPGLRFFGQAVDGALDLSGDNLVDLAVGAEGHVLVIRICAPGPPLHFRVEAEPERGRPRAGLEGAGPERGWAGSWPLGAGPGCQEAELRVKRCPEDFVTPLRLRLSLSLPHSDPPGPVLPPKPLPGLIPFEQRCGADELCESDLWVRADPGGAAVVGDPGAELGVRLRVGNGGEDAYGAALQVGHPPGLSFHRARARRGSSPVPIDCRSPEVAVGQPWGLSCALGGPILRGGWELTLELIFHLLPTAAWGESVGLSAAVTSNNEPLGAMGDNNVTWSVPVRFAVGLAVTWEDESTQYLNFSAHRPLSKSLEHRYRVELLQPLPHGSPSPLVTPFVLLPHTLPHGVTVADPQVHA
ncbi:integrin alpha-L-like, partial [Aegotheles albertisi]